MKEESRKIVAEKKKADKNRRQRDRDQAKAASSSGGAEAAGIATLAAQDIDMGDGLG
jgi:hypothetical protein